MLRFFIQVNNLFRKWSDVTINIAYIQEAMHMTSRDKYSILISGN